MKIKLLVSLVLLPAFLASRVDASAVPVFEDTFNAPGERLRFVNGAGLGTPGTGVSGKVQDLAYVSLPATTEQDPRSPAAQALTPLAPMPMEAFTVTFWYFLEENAPDLQVPLSFSSGVILLHRNGFEVRVVQPTKDLQFTPGVKGPLLDWTTPGRWIFAGFIWERSSNTMTFHQGTPESVVTFMRSLVRAGSAEPAVPRANLDRFPDVIGNMHGRGDRPLAGRLDNIRIFNQALNQDELEQIRRADLENRPVKLR